jgi:predicted acetylornithine/succinylornithine family transaminase
MKSNLLEATTPMIDKAKSVLMNNYSQFPLVLAKGEGCYVEDTAGKKYLDFVAGIAVNSLGQCEKTLVAAVEKQLHTMWHCSNLYYNEPAINLAALLTANSDFDKAFFCNSGTEAMEAAIKLARKYSKTYRNEDCFEIISMSNSFHGRTLGALSATGQDKYHHGFEPMLPGCKVTPLNDLAALKEAITPQTSAIIIEPIQGEGGINEADVNFLKSVKEICQKNKIVLIFDEVQCGLGRMGHLFAYQASGVAPDIVALAKGLAGGFPMGAILAVDEVAQAFQPGDHGCTFGGNLLASTAALVVVKKLIEPGFLAHIQTVGEEFKNSLMNLKSQYKFIQEIRGAGLIWGVELDQPVKPIIESCMAKGLLVASAGPNVLRFLPPLIIEKTQIQEGMGILNDVLKGFSK